jgi:hypothetical protein
MTTKSVQALASVGLSLPRLLLPAPNIDLTRFSVIACDQFSAQPEYWKAVEDTVGDHPSALRLILPEAWLNEQDTRIGPVQETMERYLSNGTLCDKYESFIFLHRQTSTGIRRGLIVALDLEQYDYSPGSQSMVRTTEGTVVDRLPPRVRIRRGAALESSHVMVLIDDQHNRLMRLLDDRRSSMELLYDFPLMLGGGHSTGWRVDDPALLGEIAQILEQLRHLGDGLLYAVGDGNHSLAAAKRYWEEIKPALPADRRSAHPARYALVEIVNLHDPALHFEPIHRLLENVNPDTARTQLGLDDGLPPILEQLQPLLDRWLSAHPNAKLEYIHGEDDCRRLGEAPGKLAIVLPDFDKHTLFDRVRRHGALERKSFSMGQAKDKRYYLECRAIR